MKYKRLTSEELNALEKEFIHFLAAAQITGGDWEKMKKNEIEKAEDLLDVFSDMVYEKVLGKIHYLEFIEKNTFTVFNCELDKIQLIVIKVKENSTLDLSDENVFANWNEEHTAAIRIAKSEKKYSETKELEVFQLLQTGCLITDKKRFDLLNSLVENE
jgi:Family of unknown function (DUF6495)